MIQRLTLALLLLVAGLLCVVYARQDTIRAPTVKEVVEALRGDKVNLNITNSWSNGMQTYTSSWKDAHGVSHSVTTNRNADESDADFLARHKAAVALLMVEFPPVV